MQNQLAVESERDKKTFLLEFLPIRGQILVTKQKLKEMRKALDDQLQNLEEPVLIPQVHRLEEAIINLIEKKQGLEGRNPLQILEFKRKKLISLAEKYEKTGEEFASSRVNLYFREAYNSDEAAQMCFSCAEASRLNASHVSDEIVDFHSKNCIK